MLDSDGSEVTGSERVALPIGYKRPPTLAETIASMIKNQEIINASREAGIDTFDEADDFDIPDDPEDPQSPHEACFDPGHVVVRDQEIKNGFVEEIPDSDKKGFSDIVDKAKAAKAAKPDAPKGASIPA